MCVRKIASVGLHVQVRPISYNIGGLEKFPKFPRKHPCRSLLSKKGLRHWCYSVNSVKFCRIFDRLLKKRISSSLSPSFTFTHRGTHKCTRTVICLYKSIIKNAMKVKVTALTELYAQKISMAAMDRH